MRRGVFPGTKRWKQECAWAKVLVESFVEEPSRLGAVVRETRSSSRSVFQYEAVETKSFSWAKVLVESFVEEPSRPCAVVRKTRSCSRSVFPGTKLWKLRVFHWQKFLS